MKHLRRKSVVNPLTLGVRLALGSLAAIALSGAAFAQDAPATEDEATTLDPVSVLGTRSAGRSATDSAVPIDIIG